LGQLVELLQTRREGRRSLRNQGMAGQSLSEAGITEFQGKILNEVPGDVQRFGGEGVGLGEKAGQKSQPDNKVTLTAYDNNQVYITVQDTVVAMEHEEFHRATGLTVADFGGQMTKEI